MVWADLLAGRDIFVMCEEAMPKFPASIKHIGYKRRRVQELSDAEGETTLGFSDHCVQASSDDDSILIFLFLSINWLFWFVTTLKIDRN